VIEIEFEIVLYSIDCIVFVSLVECNYCREGGIITSVKRLYSLVECVLHCIRWLRGGNCIVFVGRLFFGSIALYSMVGFDSVKITIKLTKEQLILGRDGKNKLVDIDG